MVIDGGFAKAYHNTTGIAGYTLVFHSRGFQLVQHEPFTSAEEAIKNGTDIVSTTQIVEMSTQRMMVRDTDKGAELESQIEELKELLYAYRHGFIKESTKISFGAERFLYIILPFHASQTAVDGRARKPERPMLPAPNAIGTKDGRQSRPSS